ncbi:hypothetical protein ACN28E_02440 [Archangium lansingense]|uniref:hypothetical protein n=1 Tax=Archangium lansingense TaxID=2995310 RepID=UPI003B7F007A
MSPQDTARLLPRYESVAANTGVKLVGPGMNWGTYPGYSDPVVWLDFASLLGAPGTVTELGAHYLSPPFR